MGRFLPVFMLPQSFPSPECSSPFFLLGDFRVTNFRELIPSPSVFARFSFPRNFASFPNPLHGFLGQAPVYISSSESPLPPCLRLFSSVASSLFRAISYFLCCDSLLVPFLKKCPASKLPQTFAQPRFAIVSPSLLFHPLLLPTRLIEEGASPTYLFLLCYEYKQVTLLLFW